jgi:hypothetical protein
MARGTGYSARDVQRLARSQKVISVYMRTCMVLELREVELNSTLSPRLKALCQLTLDLLSNVAFIQRRLKKNARCLIIIIIAVTEGTRRNEPLCRQEVKGESMPASLCYFTC